MKTLGLLSVFIICVSPACVLDASTGGGSFSTAGMICPLSEAAQVMVRENGFVSLQIGTFDGEELGVSTAANELVSVTNHRLSSSYYFEIDTAESASVIYMYGAESPQTGYAVSNGDESSGCMQGADDGSPIIIAADGTTLRFADGDSPLVDQQEIVHPDANGTCCIRCTTYTVCGANVCACGRCCITP